MRITNEWLMKVFIASGILMILSYAVAIWKLPSDFRQGIHEKLTEIIIEHQETQNAFNVLLKENDIFVTRVILLSLKNEDITKEDKIAIESFMPTYTIRGSKKLCDIINSNKFYRETIQGYVTCYE